MLEGIRVIEMTEMGDDLCGMFLGDMGADVIKIEPPTGDPIRNWIVATDEGCGVFHVALNRNKRSVVADTNDASGVAAIQALVKGADVVVRTYTPDAPDELGYEALRAIHPGIVYCDLSPFGVRSPYAGIPGSLPLASAAAGAWRLSTDPDGNVQVIDGKEVLGEPGVGEQGGAGGPVYATYGILAALFRRARTGEGAYLDVAHSDSAIAVAGYAATSRMEGDRSKKGKKPTGVFQGGAGPSTPKYNWYETKDHKHVLLVAIEQKFWNNFVRVVDRPDLVDESEWDSPVDWGRGKFGLSRELQGIFQQRTGAEWVQIFRDHNIAGGLGVPPRDLAADPHIRHRGILVETEHPRAGTLTLLGSPFMDVEVRRPAPDLGEHTEEVLEQLTREPETP